MGIACLGECEVHGAGDCPKHLPPVFNPTPAFLLDMLFPAHCNPESWKWEQVRARLASRIDLVSGFRPVDIQGIADYWGQSVVEWIKRRDAGALHGALPWPSGVRALSSELEPHEFVEAVEAIQDSLADARDTVEGFRGEGASNYGTVLAQMIEIGHCAERNLSPPHKIVIVYGW
ncbi:MAG: hypothetical protein M1319_05130 [Chloroflexi bacterium]|nr:hypothetical protein [Chloroflexota bacterium]